MSSTSVANRAAPPIRQSVVAIVALIVAISAILSTGLPIAG